MEADVIFDIARGEKLTRMFERVDIVKKDLTKTAEVIWEGAVRKPEIAATTLAELRVDKEAGHEENFRRILRKVPEKQLKEMEGIAAGVMAALENEETMDGRLRTLEGAAKTAISYPELISRDKTFADFDTAIAHADEFKEPIRSKLLWLKEVREAREELKTYKEKGRKVS